jgi:hypothetical protein
MARSGCGPIQGCKQIDDPRVLEALPRIRTNRGDGVSGSGLPFVVGPREIVCRMSDTRRLVGNPHFRTSRRRAVAVPGRNSFRLPIPPEVNLFAIG